MQRKLSFENEYGISFWREEIETPFGKFWETYCIYNRELIKTTARSRDKSLAFCMREAADKISKKEETKS